MTTHPNLSAYGRTRGFTLVELSIVLVILGLLVGGVLGGQSLIRAAELRAIVTERDSYQTALGTFRNKYFALPGDMPNAVRYWGRAAGASDADGYVNACASTSVPSTTSATCNGDGNGIIGNVGGSYAYELHRAWQHLANAGLVEGSYTGIRYDASGSFTNYPGINQPRSKISGAGWTLVSPQYWVTASVGYDWYPVQYGTTLLIGKPEEEWISMQPALKAEEAYNIDMKVDDGKPHTGQVLTLRYASQPNCVTSADNAYALSVTQPGCMLIFKTGY